MKHNTSYTASDSTTPQFFFGFFECVKMAFLSIKANKMRSLLTMLGIIIGISSVITITTIGNTIQGTLANAFNQFGTNVFYVYLDQRNYENQPYLTDEDKFDDEKLNGLIDKYPGQFKLVQWSWYSTGTVLNSDFKPVNVNVRGVSDGNFESDRIKILKGRAITHRDNIEKRYTAVVSNVFANQYNKGEPILGETILVTTDEGESLELSIVGVYDYSPSLQRMFGGFEAGISEMDRTTPVFIPHGLVNSLNNIENETTTFASVLWNVDMGAESAEENIREYFEKLYESNESWGVYIYNEQLWVDMTNQVMSIIVIAISFIAAISLFVGGIGVMNIMLVSIVERTNEIGVRKALGAQNSSIRMQFVIEAIIICVIGGILGIVIGLSFSFLLGIIALSFISSTSPEYLEIFDIAIRPSISAILISLASSTFVGLVFGYYPANRAAKMNPIDALRHE